MAVKSIYTKYFQKSKVFLYPLLGFKRGIKVVPSETYLAWDPFYIPEDIKLICLYHPDNSDDYNKFEKEFLMKHNRMIDVKNISDNNKLFVFDFSDYKDDWNHFITGSYSKFSTKSKDRILKFFDRNSANYVYMKSYLYPEDYFNDYASCLNVDVDTLKLVGELCNKPDIEKETFTLKTHLEKTEIIN